MIHCRCARNPNWTDLHSRRLDRDTIGVLARSVEDAARVLGALGGFENQRSGDPSDPQTALGANQPFLDDWT